MPIATSRPWPLFEMLNENSLVEAWFQNRLLGRQTGRSSGTWHDLPPSYAAELDGQFNAWLARADALELAVALARHRGTAEAAVRANGRARVEVPLAAGVRGLGLVGEDPGGADLAEVAREGALELSVLVRPKNTESCQPWTSKSLPPA